MDNDIKVWLYDMLNAIMEIESFFADRPKEFANYQADLRTKRAVERNIEIIGEAMSRILKKTRQLPSRTPENWWTPEIESFMATTLSQTM